MKTTKQSTWGATLRTTILLASLSGLLVVIGFAIGGPSTAAIFLGIALLINLGSYFFSDKIARDPRQLGLKGALDRRPVGTGSKNPSPTAGGHDAQIFIDGTGYDPVVID